MNNVLIVSASEVKDICKQINTNITDIMINDSIILFQNTTLCDKIGQEWKEEIQTQITGGTVSTSNQYIIDNFLKELISYGVWQNLSISLSLQLNEAGLRIKTSDHSEAAQTKDIEIYKNYIQNFIDRKCEQMERYIRYNPNNYTLYFNNKYGDTPLTNVFNYRIRKG